MYITGKEAEKAVLVGVALQSKGVSSEQMREYLDELSFLAETAGAETVKIFTQNLEKPVHATFIGKGKLEEIHAYTEEHEVDMIIFDDELTPTQLRNIEDIFKGIKVLDRTSLILDIFASRARTAHAKTQVELAQYTGGDGNRDRPADYPGQDYPPERRVGKNRPPEGHTAQEPGQAGAGGFGGLYECREVHLDEPVEQVGGVCRK